MSELLVTNPIFVLSAAMLVLAVFMLMGWLAYVLTGLRHSGGLIVITKSSTGERTATKIVS